MPGNRMKHNLKIDKRNIIIDHRFSGSYCKELVLNMMAKGFENKTKKLKCV